MSSGAGKARKAGKRVVFQKKAGKAGKDMQIQQFRLEKLEKKLLILKVFIA